MSRAASTRNDRVTDLAPDAAPDRAEVAAPVLPSASHTPINRATRRSVSVTKLPSGLTVVSETIPGLETAAVGLWARAGSRDETESEHGLAHFLEHMAFKGTTRRDARAIAETIEAVGGELNAETTQESTAYYARVLGEDAPLALDILADIVVDPVFDPAELEREKGVIIQEIGSYEDAPEELIYDRFMDVAFAGAPIGRPILGTRETVQGFNADTARRYLSRHYTAPNVVLCATGDVDHARLVEEGARHLGNLPTSQPPAMAPAVYAGGERREARRLEQAHVVIGFAGLSYHADAHFALHAFTNIVGEGMASRLFQQVREARGLAYEVHAFHWSFADAGVFGLYGGTGGAETGEFVKVALDCVAQATVDATEAELGRAKAQMKVGMMTALESPGRRAEQLARQIMAHGRVLDRAEVLARIDALTVPDVRAAGAAMLRTPPTLVGLGPIRRMPSLGAVAARVAG